MSQRRIRSICRIFATVAFIALIGLTSQQGALADGGGVSGPAKSKVTIDVKDTDIRQVLDAFSKQTDLSIVIGKEVRGSVTVRLINVPWDRALEAVLKPYGYGSERSGGVITVLPLEQLNQLNQTQPLSSRVFRLIYRDAKDLQPVIEGLLSPRGRVKAVEETGQKGWEFGAFGSTVDTVPELVPLEPVARSTPKSFKLSLLTSRNLA